MIIVNVTIHLAGKEGIYFFLVSKELKNWILSNVEITGQAISLLFIFQGAGWESIIKFV